MENILISETNLEDSQGNVVIKPGLKVRHSDSQFEYTVEDVIDGSSGIEVILRTPESPRKDLENLEPGTTDVLGDNKKQVMYEFEVSASSEDYYYPDEDSNPQEEETVEFISVGKEEFEKDYEVK